MKHDDWTRQLNRRLANRETPAPDDLWEKIEMRLDAKDNKPVLKPRYTIRRIATWSVSAAAVAALLVTIGYKANEDTIERLTANSPKAHADNAINNATPNTASTTKPNAEPAYGSSTNATTQLVAAKYNYNGAASNNHAGKSIAAANEAMAIDNANAEDIAEANTEANVAYKEDEASVAQHSAEMEKKVVVADNKRYAPHNTAPRMMYVENDEQDKQLAHWSIGAHTAGSMMDSQYANMPVARSINASMMGDLTNDDETSHPNIHRPVGNAALMSRYSETKHHAQPVSYGVSVGYAINNRMSLITGVVYTRAVTDFIRSSGKDDITETQRLHYIGVPLGIKYRVWNNKHIQTYATAGGQADFNVKATMTAADVKTDVDRDNVQFSVNAAAGIQLDVVPHVGLYAEPGVKYYIDNNSQVVTIFKDKPWAFNLQVGLRVEF